MSQFRAVKSSSMTLLGCGCFGKTKNWIISRLDELCVEFSKGKFCCTLLNMEMIENISRNFIYKLALCLVPYQSNKFIYRYRYETQYLLATKVIKFSIPFLIFYLIRISSSIRIRSSCLKTTIHQRPTQILNFVFSTTRITPSRKHAQSFNLITRRGSRRCFTAVSFR